MHRCTNHWAFYWTGTVLVAASLVLGSCSKAPDEEIPGASGRVCIADSIQALQRSSTVPSCEPDSWLCRARCLAGSATSCVAMAYAAEKHPTDKAEAVRLYRRACLLGEANACTNYAATIWVNDHSDEQLACARRTFEKACAAKEPFACGMVGRLMLESTAPPQYAQARKYLEVACDEVSGFPCRVLAKHLESGNLGEYQPGVIRSLLARACAAGDPDACGKPATAAETFR
jgi:TPR repeat protein